MRKETKIEWAKKTDLPLYDNFLEDPDYAKRAKGLEVRVVHLTPQEYIDHCATIFDMLPSALRASRLQTDVDRLKKAIVDGKQIFLPVLDFAYGCQEGMHRALACEQLGIDRMPVVFVEKEEG